MHTCAYETRTHALRGWDLRPLAERAQEREVARDVGRHGPVPGVEGHLADQKARRGRKVGRRRQGGLTSSVVCAPNMNLDAMRWFCDADENPPHVICAPGR